MQGRGPGSLGLSKVKGHATHEHVQAGLVSAADRAGNAAADGGATLGIADHHALIPALVRALVKRHKAYVAFVVRVTSMFARVLREDARLRKEQRRALHPVAALADSLAVERILVPPALPYASLPRAPRWGLGRSRWSPARAGGGN